MKLIALLSFYDEPIQSITDFLLGLHRAGVEQLVAVDGAYALFPDGRPASSANEHAALILGARELGIACTLHVPAVTWEGNEVAKRNFLFDVALTVAEPGEDWFMVIDTDEAVTAVPADLRDRLAATEHDAGRVTFIDVPALAANDPTWPSRFTDWRLMRAQRLRCEPNHSTWVTDDGRYLRNGTHAHDPEPALEIPDLVVEHRPLGRPHARQAAKLDYYARRDELGIERGQCAWCEKRAARLVAVDWKLNEVLGAPVSEWREACAAHAADAERVGAFQLQRLGIDPARVKSIENRNGQPPRPAVTA